MGMITALDTNGTERLDSAVKNASLDMSNERRLFYLLKFQPRLSDLPTKAISIEQPAPIPVGKVARARLCGFLLTIPRKKVFLREILDRFDLLASKGCADGLPKYSNYCYCKYAYMISFPDPVIKCIQYRRIFG